MSISTSSAIASSSTLPPPLLLEDLEFDRILNAEASLQNREEEVMRVLKSFKMNPYEILELNWMPSAKVTESEIQKAYRKKSLLIHPDKLKHERGIEAFDLLKKASSELLDPTKRTNIDQTIVDARMLILRSLGLKAEAPDTHEKCLNLKKETGNDFKESVRIKTKEILIDDELRRRRVNKMTMIAEGAEAARVEESIEKRKRKVEDDKKWEDSREDRIQDWRKFQKGSKKKSKKDNVLG